jgi:membrane protein DedA with SNARE-associated domain
MLVLAGVLINNGSLNLAGALILAVAGFNLGATAAYYIGKTAGEPFFSKFEKVFSISHQKLDMARTWIEQSAAAFIILGRFVPMASNLTPYIAGMSGLSPARFLLFNSIFAVCWSSFNIALGYYFSRSWMEVMKFTETRLPYIAGAVLVLYIVLALLVRKKMRL